MFINSGGAAEQGEATLSSMGHSYLDLEIELVSMAAILIEWHRTIKLGGSSGDPKGSLYTKFGPCAPYIFFELFFMNCFFLMTGNQWQLYQGNQPHLSNVVGMQDPSNSFPVQSLGFIPLIF